ncbi:MAG: NAD-dependent epimerase/dehydratase family protein [Deltaproteobacteria bacterium]|nr:NAD-dependent epimerase/dehydratase family protein [Deltaproteobacteria bacterium]
MAESGYGGMRVLVTGGAGAIGVNLSARLLELGASVVVLDDFSSAYEWNLPNGVELVRGDVRDESALAEAFGKRPNRVFHLAAHFANQNSVDHPETSLDVNGMGTLRVLERCRQARVERVVFASSGCGVYGPECPLPFREEQVSLRLHTPYQLTKLLGELLGNYFHVHYGLPFVSARLFNVYGPGEVPGHYRNVIPNFFFRAIRGEALPITGTGEETRDWTFVRDAVDALLAMGTSEAAVGEAFNVASGTEVRVIDMAEDVNRITGNKAGIRHLPRRDWDAKTRLCASIGKARALLGYEPRVPFREGLEQVHAWFTGCWNSIRASTDLES